MPTRRVAGAEAAVEAEAEAEAEAVVMVPEALPEEAPGLLPEVALVAEVKEGGAIAALLVLPPEVQADKSAETSFKESARGITVSVGIPLLANSSEKEGVKEMSASSSIPSLVTPPETPQLGLVTGTRWNEAGPKKRRARKRATTIKVRAKLQSSRLEVKRRKTRKALSAELFLV